MQIKKIYLRNYRNYAYEEVFLSNGINIFFGQNAQGKTNIIESICLLSTGRSHRTQKDSELIRWNDKEAKVKIVYEKDNDEQIIEILLKKNLKKQIKINGVTMKKTSDLLGNLNAVIFSPDHMKIIKEGPVERRRFVDIILSQVKPGYYYNLTHYLKVLEQRNNLLNEARKNDKLLSTLEVWDEQLIYFGSKVIKERNYFIKQIGLLASNTHHHITNGKEELSIKYHPSIGVSEEKTADHLSFDEESIKKVFEENLKAFRKIDARRGISHKGPHRDDMDLFVNNKELKNFGSQGQQRTALLSLKIAELQYMESETSNHPVLLLDDVFSELDTERQKFLLNFIKNVQTIITCTDVQYFKNLDIEDYKVFEVTEGKVVKKETAETG